MGDEVISDVHLSDWGAQMGIIIEIIREFDPTLSYFRDESKAESKERYAAESPITLEDINRLYPEVSALSKSHSEFRRRASEATAKLQAGHRGYRSL